MSIRVTVRVGNTVSEHVLSENETLLDALRRLGYHVDAPCGGHGRCGKCRVQVTGDVSPVTADESKALSQAELDRGWRLSCETKLLGPAEIRLTEKQQIYAQTEGQGELTFDPWANGLGLAVDIGTTTVAAYLYDLDTGRELATGGVKNAQGDYGADVVSRQEYALAGGGKTLQDCILRCLGELCGQLCEKAGKSVGDISAAVITGNTTMLYLLHNYDVREIAVAPFCNSHTFGCFEPAADFFPDWKPGAQIYFPACISCYVGADITCSVLASGLNRMTRPALLADIGTNGELVLTDGSHMLCCATAAGPAFEGAGISMGGNAFPGAIDKVWVREDGTLGYHVLGDVPARSICGSGLLDAVAALLETGDLQESGRLAVKDPAGIGDSTVSLTGNDVRAVQLAKAAVCGGMETLIHRGLKDGITPPLYIAGGFGSKLDPRSAEAIGLICQGMGKTAKAIGNAAGQGAVMLLLDQRRLEESLRIARETETVELTTDPVFSEKFIENIPF